MLAFRPDPDRNRILVMLFALLGILAGIGIAMRYRAFALIPATVVAWIVVIATEVALGATALMIVAGMLATGAALQFGFPLGVALRRLALAARGSRRREGTPQLP
jgi:hypothetical protein